MLNTHTHTPEQCARGVVMKHRTWHVNKFAE
jgi:hypothetical protein